MVQPANSARQRGRFGPKPLFSEHPFHTWRGSGHFSGSPSTAAISIFAWSCCRTDDTKEELGRLRLVWVACNIMILWGPHTCVSKSSPHLASAQGPSGHLRSTAVVPFETWATTVLDINRLEIPRHEHIRSDGNVSFSLGYYLQHTIDDLVVHHGVCFPSGFMVSPSSIAPMHQGAPCMEARIKMQM